MATVKVTARVVRLALKSSSVVEDVTLSGRAFHSLVDLWKKEYLYRSLCVRCCLMRCPPLDLVSSGM